NGQGNTGPHLADLLLRMKADMRLAMLAVGCADRVVVKPCQLGSDPGLDLAQKLVEAPRIEQVLEARLLPVGTVSFAADHAQDGAATFHRSLGLDIAAAEFGEVPVPGDASETKQKGDIGMGQRTPAHTHRREGDVVGVLKHGNCTSAVEADVELAR